MKKKLGTQDRLYNPLPGVLCLFCGSQPETHDHLFFECTVSKQVCDLVKSKAECQIPDLPWAEMIEWMATNWRGKTLGTQIKKLCLSSMIYLLWRDRNQRFHTNSVSSPEAVALLITEQVRLKLSTFRGVEMTDLNKSYQARWNLPDSIYLMP